jgi:hypothetical protein
MDRVIDLNEPQSSVGAPNPMIAADGVSLYVAYHMQDEQSDFELEAIGLVKFSGLYLHLIGAPNDEAFSGHPLYKNGLRPYGTFVIEDSSWIKEYAKRNRVHPYHSDDLFENYNHYVWSFHDETLEVISESYEFEIMQGSPASVIIQQLKSNS